MKREEKGMKKGLLCVSCVTLLLMSSCSSGVPQENHDKLKSSYESVQAENESINSQKESLLSDIESLSANLESAQNEYDAYKFKILSS